MRSRSNDSRIRSGNANQTEGSSENPGAYGAGTFALFQLRRAAVDLLKIDRSLINSMLSDRASRDVVELLLTLGRQWKINVVAQGIEKASQCECLKQLGCLLGQGYLFSPPFSADAATQFLHDQAAVHPVRNL